MVKTAIDFDAGPIAFRYPRGAGVGADVDPEMVALPIGRSEVLRKGNDVALLALGSMVYPALGAADILMNEGIAATVINARFVKPLDTGLLDELASGIGKLVTVEENAILGGFGSAVTEYLVNSGHSVTIANLGLADRFFDHASQSRLRDLAGLSPDGIALSVKALLERTPARPLTSVLSARS